MTELAMKVATDRARGALLGALAGDAAGATLEFIGRVPTAAEVEAAMRMVGGGVWRTAPGQITDDGELTLALARALCGQPGYDAGRVARHYRAWCLSRPFDIGNATYNALGTGDPDDPQLATLMRRNAMRLNAESKANGSLMRASALGVWSAGVAPGAAIEAARHDARLTHPHPTCQWAGVAYVLAIRQLLLCPGDATGALAAAASGLTADDAGEVRAWLDDARAARWPAFHPQAGFVRIAFTCAFAHLARVSTYAEALAATLAGGGDTDTNACIVGGLIGALQGEQAIPAVMRSAVLTCDTTRGQPRPEWLQTRQCGPVLDGLWPRRRPERQPGPAQDPPGPAGATGLPGHRTRRRS